MLQRLITTLILIVYTTTLLRAQQAVLSGYVSDSVGTAIPHARIELKNSPEKFVADTSGFYHINVRFGKYIITVYSVGYKPVTESIKVSSLQEKHNFILRPDVRNLDVLQVTGDKQDFNGLRRLSDVENMGIYAGKKNEVVVMNGLNANLATNNARQIYAKVPGVNIVENDSYGVQLGIATRGLNPNRTTEFNARQNGYDISADPIGYPESYYTPATEAISRVEIVRGAASLQYGTQFGGLLNFQFKKGNPDRKFELDTRQTLGSYGMFNSFNAVGGQIGKVNYYGFYQHKQADGWRENTNLNLNSGYGSVKWEVTPKLKVGLELTMMQYLMKQPGGLTDEQFAQDPRASYRDRNWFKAKWIIPALHIDYQLGERTRLNMRTYGLVAERGSIGNILSPLKDKTDTTARRQLSYDHYNNFGLEIRMLHRYRLAGKASSLLSGVRYFHGNTKKQQGSGYGGNDANFNFPDQDHVDEFDYRFPSNNSAFFVENVVWLNDKWTVTPGFRLEYINTNSSGYSITPVTNEVVYGNEKKTRIIPLFGIGLNYAVNTRSEFYFNISQNYSPVNFSDILVRTPNFEVDPDLKDVTGFNADLGFRGQVKNWLNFDLSLYYLDYNNRIGIIRKASDDGLEVIRYRTNVGRSRSVGAEVFGELNFFSLAGASSKAGDLSLFGSVAFTEATYTEAINPLLTTLIVGNKVEYAPQVITRTGVTYRKNRFSTTLQLAYNGLQYTDAYNSPHTADGLVGEIPSYTIIDWSANYQVGKLNFALTLNNLFNKSYFTRRALGFPGPGIIPSDGRTGYLTVGFKL